MSKNQFAFISAIIVAILICAAYQMTTDDRIPGVPYFKKPVLLEEKKPIIVDSPAFKKVSMERSCTPHNHKLVWGDTLSALALKESGEWSRYPEIANANPDIIIDSDIIFAGDTIVIPCMMESALTKTPNQGFPLTANSHVVSSEGIQVSFGKGDLARLAMPTNTSLCVAKSKPATQKVLSVFAIIKPTYFQKEGVGNRPRRRVRVFFNVKDGL